MAFRDLNQITDTEAALGTDRIDDDAYAVAASSLERLRALEDDPAEGARRRISALRQRLGGSNDSAANGDLAARIRQLRDRELDPEQPSWDDGPTQRGPGQRPTV